jgi:phosphotransferase system HPr-like phosphotransfer protein
MQLELLACDISFGERVRIFSRDYLKSCKYITRFDSPKYLFTKKLFSTLIGSSQVLEDFLDFHGAKNNSDWYFYRELAAAVRHLSLGGYCLTHISNRLIFYDLKDSETFNAQGTETLDFVRSALIHLAPVILSEAERLQIAIPVDEYTMADFPGVTTSEQLAYDIYDTNKDLQKKNIVKIASDLIQISGNFDSLGLFEPVDMDEIRRLVPDKVNEVEIRRFEMLVHNLQSSFDTYVIHGGYRFGDRKLKALRGHFSVVFHLLQMIGRLLHFYERHLHEAGYKSIYKQVQELLAALVNPEQLLDRTINYGLYWVCYYLNNGRRLAQEILNENIERGAIEVGIPQKLGFHSRPSLLVAKIVQHYSGQVELVVGQDRFDASSVLDLQWAGGKINKEGILRVTFEGDVRALADIEILASVNYGEDSMGKGVPLPKALDYLR